MAGSARSCCVPYCSTTLADQIPLHAFPHPEKEKERFLMWVKAVGSDLSTLDNQYIYKNRKICHDHFENKYLTWTRRLISNAVPTLRRPGFQVQSVMNDIANIVTVGAQVDHAIPSTSSDACDSVVKHNEPPSKNRRTDSYDTTPTDQGSSSNQEPIDPSITKAVNLNTESCTDPAIPTAKREGYSEDVDDYLCQEDNAVVPSDAEADSEGELFSWQQDGAVVPSDDENEKEVGPDLWVGPGLACSPERARASSTCDDDVYRCDSCKTHIQGFRYTCVQCADVDLCCACEARQAHAQHYVLRIPGPRPHHEVSAMLTRVRRALLSDGLIQAPGGATGTAVEIKEETEDSIKVEAAQDSLANLYTSCESQPIQEGIDSDGTDVAVKSETDSNSADPLEGPIDYVEGSETLNAKEVSETSSLRVPTISTNIEIISKLQPVKYKALMKSREPLKRPGDLDDCGQNKKVKTIRTKKKYPEDTSTKTDDVSNKEFKTISVTSTNLRKPESSKSITRLTSSKPTNKNYKILEQSLPDTAKSTRLLLPENLTKKEVPSALGNTTNKKYKIILEKVPDAAINKRLLPQVNKHSKLEIVPGTSKHLKLNLSEANVQVEHPDTATSIDRLFPRTLDDAANKQIQSKP